MEEKELEITEIEKNEEGSEIIEAPEVIEEIEPSEKAPEKLDIRRIVLYLIAGLYMMYLAYRILFNPEVAGSQRIAMYIVGIVFGLSGGAMIGGSIYFWRRTK